MTVNAASLAAARLLASASSDPPAWLQALTDVALTLGAVFGLSAYWFYRRSGPRVRIDAEYDARNTLRISVVNVGRLNSTIIGVGVGTLRRKRIKRKFRRIPDAIRAEPDFEIAGPETPLTIRPGDIYIWYGHWPPDSVTAFLEPRWGETRDPAKRTVTSPKNRHVKAVVFLNDRCLGRRFVQWPATAASFDIPEEHPIAIDGSLQRFIDDRLKRFLDRA